MALTVDEIFEMTMDLIDERPETGVLSEDDVIEYRVKTPGILNTLQAKFAEDGDYIKTHSISQYFPEAVYKSFDIVTHTSEDNIIQPDAMFKTYSFEVDAPCNVYIEEYVDGSWDEVLKIATLTATSTFTNYNGSVSPSSEATAMRIRFESPYYMLIRNVALYDVLFPASRNPKFAAYVAYDMPSDFKSLDEAIQETDYNKYFSSGDLKWEGRNKLFISYSFQGNIRLKYYAVPAQLTAMTDVIALDDTFARSVLPAMLAQILLADENPSLSNLFGQIADEAAAMESMEAPESWEEVRSPLEYNFYESFQSKDRF